MSQGGSTVQPQSVSPLAPIGVEAAVNAKSDPKSTPRSKIFDEFKLTDRVGIVSGGARGLGLEMAMTLCEAGARAIYCLDIHKEPPAEWKAVQEYVQRMEPSSRLEYRDVDVTDQKAVWKIAEDIGDKEGRMDVCIAAAGILRPEKDVLDYPAEEFKEVRIVFIFCSSSPIQAPIGDERQCRWSAFHCPGSGSTNETVWK